MNKVFLNLSQNKFSSSISSDISKLSSLRSLFLAELLLTGEIPVDAMKSLSSLEQIVITSATKLRGPLFEQIGNWPNLKVFDIHGSRFTGSIPTTIGEITNLEFM